MTSHTNAIERDEFQHDAEGGAIVDSSAPLKVAGKNGATAVSARVNKVLAVREHHCFRYRRCRLCLSVAAANSASNRRLPKNSTRNASFS